MLTDEGFSVVKTTGLVPVLLHRIIPESVIAFAVVFLVGDRKLDDDCLLCILSDSKPNNS